MNILNSPRRRQPGYHWSVNFQLFPGLFLARFELGPQTEEERWTPHPITSPGPFSFYVGLLGFGVHFSRDGEYTITGVQTPLFHLGATKIETLPFDPSYGREQYAAGE